MSAFLCECLHALTGERRSFLNGPVILASGGPRTGASVADPGAMAAIQRRGGIWWFIPGPNLPSHDVFLNGMPLSSSVKLTPGDSHLVLVDGDPWILVLENRATPRLQSALWRLHPAPGAPQVAEVPWSGIQPALAAHGLHPAKAHLSLDVLPREIPLRLLARHLPVTLAAPLDTLDGNFPPPPPPRRIDPMQGDLVCPVCWLRFDRGSARSIAVHDSLRGDPLLGDSAYLRFAPRRFNSTGTPLDSAGSPCPDLACPHCHHKLPAGFLELPHHILSIVGAPGAGKTYFLSVLLSMLQKSLYRDFGLTFRDEDPTNNALINELRAQLFSAESREEALLPKTVLEGRMYEHLSRFGRKVALPRPFVYGISKPGPENSSCALVFYDNAGEHFQPNINLDDSPGALHVASSTGLMFLFDPASHAGFRRKLSGHPDPQLAQRTHRDQQDILVAEMEARIKRLRGLPPGRRISTPLAILIGKCDIWRHLIDWQRITSPVRNGHVDGSIVDANSALLRDFMLEIDPGFVANAEALSDTVRYFAVAPLGHSPERIVGGDLDGYLAPDPARLRPTMVETPVLWLLSRLAPGLVPPA
jgi:hypothetical protein